ncbi:UDP-4-amino-4-deoxy-L-arabinose--oxoglutarate aminotransferase [Tsuneonella dongtanensis]|uniref:UDP-4-amino-4-deoxy-L-arabinose--oxoglutarate aminotransferase n=1 Tax=Tsuneonella dongtanensis TaxID=692370 RepID=A0A1B2A9V2_9SPHN|nr:UDP-4-amino-4,6-dideoxy-N-acetyl-beta-L-altrosamine transaminase [Tsuneonella dongtanensis]ANY18940.1 UDP-4-amino-4-deoxy-L-arabinose--oxoglutarate aminotransferase [Tsuneonella dongtanensis]
MEFIPYSCQSIEDADVEAVVTALRSPFLTQGPEIPAFEAAFASLHQVEHCIAVANATAALHLACLALGLGPGDRGWTVPNSFVASANCIRYCGAEVDFVDIDPATRVMSVERLAEKLAAAKADGTLPKVVIPVDFAGLPADLPAIRALADEYGFYIVEDASHAVAASRDGVMVGSRWADITVFSFHAVKVVTTAEGGLCATRDPALAQRIRLLSSHGITRDPALMESQPEGGWYYEQVALGYNYRMTDLQAALGRSQLARLPAMHARRAELAARYDRLLAPLPVKLLQTAEGLVSALHLYVIEVDAAKTSATRATVFAALRDAGIGANVHYIPIHLQPDYRRLGFGEGQFPAAEAYYASAISLPLHPRLTDEQQDYVVEVLRQALG